MKLSRLALATLTVILLAACGSDLTAPTDSGLSQPGAASLDQGTMGTPNKDGTGTP